MNPVHYGEGTSRTLCPNPGRTPFKEQPWDTITEVSAVTCPDCIRLLAERVEDGLMGPAPGFYAGNVPAAGFCGNPKMATVRFGTPQPDANYLVSLTVVARGVVVFNPSVQDKVSSGFTINCNANDVGDLKEVAWFTSHPT